MTVESTYSISEASKMLEKTVYWLRWKEGKMIEAGTFVRPDGTPLVISRSLLADGTVGTYSRRKYTINDIEDMASLFISEGLYQERIAKRIKDRIALYKSIGVD